MRPDALTHGRKGHVNVNGAGESSNLKKSIRTVVGIAAQ
jgi:hypothetical protein